MKKITKKFPLVSIIVPIYNSIYFIKPFIKSILQTDYPNFEIIIVDDGSNDGTREFLDEVSSKEKKIIFIKTLVRRGIPRSRNIAIENAKGEYVAFAESDMLFDKGWLREALKVLNSSKSIGAVAGKVYDYKAKDIVQAVGLKLIPQTLWVVCRGFGDKDTDEINIRESVSMGAVGSVAKMSVVKKIRGYDEELDRIDDIDFCLRIWISGYKIVTAPRSITYHVTLKSWSIRKSSVTKIQQEVALARVLRIMIKNYELPNLARYFPQAVMILFVRALINLLKGNVFSFIGFLYALLWVCIKLSSTLTERAFVQKTRGFKDNFIFEEIMINENIFAIYKKNQIVLHEKLRNFPTI